MKFIPTDIEGLLVIEPGVYRDERGSFLESYHAQKFRDNGIITEFLQDNQSVSRKGVIRGLHFQVSPHEQGKLVRVSHGAVLDVAVDIRKGSKTFGSAFTIELNDENNRMLWIPPGFAHGFETISEHAVFNYKVNSYYHKESERGILYNDPQLKIRWNTENPVLSYKDKELPTLENYLVSNIL